MRRIKNKLKNKINKKNIQKKVRRVEMRMITFVLVVYVAAALTVANSIKRKTHGTT
jgi:cell division protein FtsB